MKEITVARSDLPADWGDAELHALKEGHVKGVMRNASDRTAHRVTGFASGYGVGLTIFGGFTFVDVTPRKANGGGAVRFRIEDEEKPPEKPVCRDCGGDRLQFGAWARWDAKGQAFGIVDLTEGRDDLWCEDCEAHPVGYEWVSLEPATA